MLTKGAVAAEEVPGGFATLYKVLTTLEDAGRCQRGYFVESLGGAQFAVASTVDRLREHQDGLDPDRPEYSAVVLAAADPANPYGSALPWPVGRDARRRRPPGPAGPQGGSARRARRRGFDLVSRTRGPFPSQFPDDPEAHGGGRGALADLVARRRVRSILVERIDGTAVLDPALAGDRPMVAASLSEAGFVRTPRGLRLRD